MTPTYPMSDEKNQLDAALVAVAIDAVIAGDAGAAELLRQVDQLIASDDYDDMATHILTTLREHDEAHEGTALYLGYGYFWAYDFKHELRGATPAARRAAHSALLGAGLKVDGRSRKHRVIIRRITGADYILNVPELGK